MSDQLQGKKIAILVANEGVEQVELTSPLDALREAGAEVDLLAPEGEEIQAFNHLDKGDTFTRTDPSATRTPATTTAWSCRAASPTPTSCAPTPTRSSSSAPSSRRASRSGRSATGRGP